MLDKLKEHLTSKNVASEISVQLCDSLESSLVGKSYSTFTGLTSTAKQALSDALTKVCSSVTICIDAINLSLCLKLSLLQPLHCSTIVKTFYF